MNKFNKTAIKNMVVGVALSATPALASAEVTLRFSDWMPLSHHTVAQGAEVFIEKIEELSDGSIGIQYFPAEQIGKAGDKLSLAQTGVADLVSVAPAYISDKLPLSGVIELPGVYDQACAGSYAFAELTQPGGVLDKAEYAPNGIRVLFVGAQGPYRALTTERQLNDLEDFQGLRVRTAGGPMDMLARELDAVSVRLSGPDVLPSLTRGTLDGVFWPLQSVESWGLKDALGHMTPNISVGSFNIVFAISERSWSRLSSEQQEILVEAGKQATRAHCEFIEGNEEKTIDDLLASGIEATPLSESDVQQVEESYQQIANSWAERLDERNLAGSEVLEAFSEAVTSVSASPEPSKDSSKERGSDEG